MRELRYLDFDLLVERISGESGYRARVVTAPSGQTRPVDFAMPFSDLELENFLLRIGRPRRQPVRALGSTEDLAIRQFGGKLFEAVFRDELRLALATSLDQAESENVGLRVRLRLGDVPDLADLPWEFLYDPANRRFLALSEWTPLVRYLDLPGRVRALTVSPPLNVLVVVAGPTDFPPLDVNVEWGKLREALTELERLGRVRVDRTNAGTLAALQRKLRQAEYHVFHYIGHGGFDTGLGDGVLAFENPQGRAQLVSGHDLGGLLHDHRTLRLAVLNSCEGARGGRTDPYSGTAQSLIRQGVSAVVAMQFEITDEAAITFSHALYEAVADGYPLDAALAEGRKAVRNQPNPIEWATPVLYLRAPDGRIFDVSTDPATSGQVSSIQTTEQSGVGESEMVVGLYDDPDYSRAVAAFFAQHWDEAVDLLTRVQARFPNHPQVKDKLDRARRQHDLARWDAEARDAADRGQWPAAVSALERIVATERDYRDAELRLAQAQAQAKVAELEADLRRLHAAQQWAAVVAVGEQLSLLDPVAADPEGLVTAARAKLAEAGLADRYGAAAARTPVEEARADAVTQDALETEQEEVRPDIATTATLTPSKARGGNNRTRPRRRNVKVLLSLMTFALVAALLIWRLSGEPETTKEQTEEEGLGTSPGRGGGAGLIALLLPETSTRARYARYENLDRPLFEAKVNELCADCSISYANANYDAAMQQQQAESALAEGAQVLVLDPVDSQVAANIANSSKLKGVPVIAYDRFIEGADYYISFDNEKVGELQATSLIYRLKADNAIGGLLMVNGSPSDDFAQQFKAGAHKVIDSSGFSILAEYDTPDWSPSQAEEWMRGQLTRVRHQLAGVYAANDGTAGAAISAMKAAGINPIPPVTGQDAELAAIQRIIAGDQYMTIYKPVKLQAERAAEAAVALLNGKQPKTDTAVDGVPTILLEPVAVTKENIKGTVVADGFWNLHEICTAEYVQACAAAGLS
jgi:ABC-type xylose transport system substrate-binding protein